MLFAVLFVSSQIVSFFLNFMKSMRILCNVVAVLLAGVVSWSCSPAKMEYTREYEFVGLYTVNKSAVQPEFEDTFLHVNNMSSHELETGDRAFMTLYCKYDVYNSKASYWSIKEVGKRVPVYSLSSPDDTDFTTYTTPYTGLEYLNFLNQFEAASWAWKGKQNIYLKYKGKEDGALFAMTVRGIKDGYLEYNLYVKADESDTESSTLLTFDTGNVADFLSDEQKPLLTDSIKTKIYVKCMNNGVLRDLAIPGNEIRR